MRRSPVLFSSIADFLKKERSLMSSKALVLRCTKILGHEPTKSELREIWIKQYAPIFGRMYKYPINTDFV